MIRTAGGLQDDGRPKEFETELAQYTTLTPIEISALFPQPIDNEELLALLKTVKDSTSDNERKAKVVANIDRVAGVVILGSAPVQRIESNPFWKSSQCFLQETTRGQTEGPDKIWKREWSRYD